ncbi:MAG TPA: FMN-binding negative transcriptional regulator [Saprospiraceae bacterium]|nr:FMN-binding negative transcriptional regulator [Saprospiraceae bacterium]
MYIPIINQWSDHDEMLDFIERFSFGTLITSALEVPTATHLPILVSEKDQTIVLNSHFARANSHWKDIENHHILVIFQEPHAYISPKNYDKPLNVPTWNYLSVHCYGRGKIIHDEVETLSIIEKTIYKYEPEYLDQWKQLPENYKTAMLKGIVAFEIYVNEVQAKKKLSQNKTYQERQNIIHSLRERGDDQGQNIAEYMQALS